VRIQKDYTCLPDLANHALLQYEQLRKGNAPIANMLNAESALRDGYFIIEYVPYEIDPKRWQDRAFYELDTETQNLLEKIKKIFEIAFAYHIGIDLHPANLRMKDDAEIVITDFCEEHFDEQTFEGHMSDRLKLWSNHQLIQEFLMGNLPTSFQKLHRSMLVSN
jgi:hypothetical protein